MFWHNTLLWVSVRFFFQVLSSRVDLFKYRFILGAAAANNSYYCIPSSQMSFEKHESEQILGDLFLYLLGSAVFF